MNSSETPTNPPESRDDRTLRPSDLDDLKGTDCVLIHRMEGFVYKVVDFDEQGGSVGAIVRRELHTGFRMSAQRLRGEPFIERWLESTFRWPGREEQTGIGVPFLYGVERRAKQFLFFHYPDPIAIRMFFLPEYVRKARERDGSGWDELVEKAMATGQTDITGRRGEAVPDVDEDVPPYLGLSAGLLKQLIGKRIEYICRTVSPVYIFVEGGLCLGFVGVDIENCLIVWRSSKSPRDLATSGDTVPLADGNVSRPRKAERMDLVMRRIERIAVLISKPFSSRGFRDEAGLLIETDDGSSLVLSQHMCSTSPHRLALSSKEELDPERIKEIIYIGK
jgi:hypothetical protein